MTAHKRTLDLIALEVALDERPMSLLDEEPMHFTERAAPKPSAYRRPSERRNALDETGDGRLELDADLVPGLCDLFAYGHEHGSTALGQPETGEPVDLQGGGVRRGSL